VVATSCAAVGPAPDPPTQFTPTPPQPQPNPKFIKTGKTLDRDFYMDAHQAAAWGIVDEVIDVRSEKSVITQ